MRRDIGTIIVGALFLAAGIAVGGSMLGYFDFTVNFAGWWTVFLIVPALLAIAQGGINAGNVILLGVGVILLLNAQGILPQGFTWRLILPVILLAVGIQLIFGNSFFYRRSHRYDRDSEKSDPSDDSGKTESSQDEKSESWNRSDTEGKTGGLFTEATRNGNTFKTASAFFASQNIRYEDEDFTGAAYTAIFGGLTINLRSVRLSGDVVINTTAIFGGIDLIVPDNVQIVSNVIPILGGVENKYPSSRDKTAPRIIVNGNAIFGGVTIK